MSRTAAELHTHLTSLSAASGNALILQPCLRNHRELMDLTPGALCTVRLITGRMPGEAVTALLGVYRMPVGQNVADNFEMGGLAAAIDVEQGVLGAAVRKDPRFLVAEIDVHPDTGARIHGRRIPFWDEVMGLALRAHEAAGQIAVIGWDIAITDHGPVFVEGNRYPGSRLSQMPTGVPLADTAMVPLLNAHMRAIARDLRRC